MEYILNVRSFCALLYKEVSVKVYFASSSPQVQILHVRFRMTINVSLIMAPSVPHC